jgi:hypothetical protein
MECFSDILAAIFEFRCSIVDDEGNLRVGQRVAKLEALYFPTVLVG